MTALHLVVKGNHFCCCLFLICSCQKHTAQNNLAKLKETMWKCHIGVRGLFIPILIFIFQVKDAEYSDSHKGFYPYCVML